MNLQEFEQSLKEPSPRPGLSDLLKALWWDAKEDWEQAHDIAQDIAGQEGSWIHAYLHRKEGDLANACYWYRQAGRDTFKGSLEEEWQQMATTFLNP